MIINHNMMAINTHRQMGGIQGSQAKSTERLSSGLRINRAGDDAAGLAISEKMRGQIRGLNQASRNSQDGISLIQTAEGALNESHEILQRMRELAVQASSDTNTVSDREKLQSELNELTSEINRIGNTTEFNTMKLLDGSKSETAVVSSERMTIAKDASFSDLAFSDVAYGTSIGQSHGVIKDGSISVDTTNSTWDNFSAGDTGNSTVITIKSTAEGTITFKLSIKSTAATTVDTVSGVITANTEGDFVWNGGGVSFTIEKETYDNTAIFTAFDANTSITIDFSDLTSVSTINTDNYWESNKVSGSNTADRATISTGITFDSDAAYLADPKLANAAKVEITFDSNTTDPDGTAVTSGVLTVVIKDANSAVLTSKTYSGVSTAETIDIDDFGLEFSFNANKATSAALTFELDNEIRNVSTSIADSSLTFQIGANENQSMSLGIDDMRADALGLSTTIADTDGYGSAMSVTDGTDATAVEYALNITDAEGAASAITKIDEAMESISTQRAKLGAMQNRLEHTIKNLDTSAENLQASESRIRDVDMAKEMMSFTKNNILMQAAQSMLAQANQAPQGVLSLLR